MNNEESFDRIVGLIYDTVNDAVNDAVNDPFSDNVGDKAHGTARADAVIQAIRAEIGEPDELLDSPCVTSSLMRRLAPHIERSGRLRSRIRQLEGRHATQQTELAHLPFGLVWVGATLQVVSQNARAVALLKPESGIWVDGNRLAAWVATDLERLEQALHNALRADDRKGILLALRRRNRPVPLLASVIPVIASPNGEGGLGSAGSTSGASDRFALVILQNPDEVALGLAHLQLVYGFTAAERKLAEALLHNDTLESYGERTGVSRSTLRSHLAHVFKKTGTNRQTELVRLLMLAQPRV